MSRLDGCGRGNEDADWMANVREVFHRNDPLELEGDAPVGQPKTDDRYSSPQVLLKYWRDKSTFDDEMIRDRVEQENLDFLARALFRVYAI